MLKINVKPAPSDVDSYNPLPAEDPFFKPNPLLEYPKDVKGDEDKMIEYSYEMASMWALEVQGLQKMREMKGVLNMKTENTKNKMLGRQETVDVANHIKATLKKEVMNHYRGNDITPKENNQSGIIRPTLMSKKFSINNTIACRFFGDSDFAKPNIKVLLVLILLFLGMQISINKFINI